MKLNSFDQVETSHSPASRNCLHSATIRCCVANSAIAESESTNFEREKSTKIASNAVNSEQRGEW
jgi:hypothetical protein